MIKLHPFMATLALGMAASSGGAETGSVFTLPAAPLEMVTDDAKFRGFGEKVQAEVERLLGVPAAVDDPVTLSVLLSSRVHLAHYFRDDEKAIATAAWIRTQQPDPALRAFAGLSTLAAVEARRKHPSAAPDSAGARETFFREFSRQLAGLPQTAAITAMLRGQRDKIAGLSKDALLAETRDVIVPALARRGYCGLAEADQLVRVRHRLTSILPLRDEFLRAFDAAIAARPAS